MQVSHWIALFSAGTLLTASCVAVRAAQDPAASGNLRTTAADKDLRPSLTRDTRIAQAKPQAPAAPQRVETIKYDSWVVVCEDTVGGPAKKTCSASLRISTQNQRQLILNWQIGTNKEGRFVTAFHVPPALSINKDNRAVGGPLLLANGVEIKFGNAPARRIAYQWCGPQQCFAEALIDDAFVKEALANTTATITVYTLGGGPIPFDVPIKGIDKAISATRK